MASQVQATNSMSKPMQRRLFFIGLTLAVAVRVVFLLPSELDFRNFAFRDVGSFQHVDRLIGLGLHPGVDFGFTYGLLPVLLQHMYFAVFGAGQWPTLGVLVIYLLAMVAFWILFLREFGPTLTNFGVFLGLLSMTIYIDPWPPTPAHVLMQLSLAYSLYFLLKQRLSLALLIAALGTLTIPSLPIALTGLVALVIAREWWRGPRRTLRRLATQFGPAAVAYAAAVLVMTVFFGWRSVLPSLVPVGGAKLYRAMNYGILGQGKFFLHPPGANLSYYLFTIAGIWILCSGLLVVFGCVGALRLATAPRKQGHTLFVVVCCVLHLVFVFVAFGNYLSYVYYSFLLAAGILAGVSELRSRRWRIAVGSLVLVLGLLSQVGAFKAGLQLWRSESRSPATGFLYAPNDFQAEWSSVLSFAQNRRVFLIAYGMGVEYYYPQIGTPQSWFLMPGLLLPREDSYVAQQIRTADVVVEEREVTTHFIDDNKEWQAALAVFPVQVSGKYFRIYTKDRTAASELTKSAAFNTR